MKTRKLAIVLIAGFALLFVGRSQARAQQKELPEVSLMTAIPNLAFSAIWLAEQLKYFEAEGVRVKITPAPTGSVWLNAAVGRSVNDSASTSDGLVVARVEGSPATAIQAQ